MNKTQYYKLNAHRHAHEGEVENLVYQEWIARLGCTFDTYKDIIAREGFQPLTTTVDNPFYIGKFYLSEGNRSSEDSESLFGFAEVFVKRHNGWAERIPDRIYVAENADDWLRIVQMMAGLGDVRTQFLGDVGD